MTERCENHGADHVHDMTELDSNTDETPVKINPGESRIPAHGGDFDAKFTNFNPEKGIRDAYIAYAKVDTREFEKDPTLRNCVLVGANFTAGRYDGEKFVPDPDGEEVQIARRYVSNFDRIARITGYLTGSVDRWNNAKKAELRDRTRHGIAHEATIGRI